MVRFRFTPAFLLMGVAVIALTACSAEERSSTWKKAEGAVMQDKELGYNRDDFRRAMAPRPMGADANKTNVPDLVPVVSDDKKNILPQPLVSISVNQDVPLRDIFFELAKQAEVDLELDPTITGSIIFTAKDRPFDQAVDRICELAGLRYTFKNNVLRVERDTPYLKTYRIDYLGIQRDYTSTINSNTSAATSGSSGGGTNGSSSKISVANKTDFWADLEKNISQIIDNSNKQVSLTNQSGPVATATAVPAMPVGQLAAVNQPPGGAAPIPSPTPAPAPGQAENTGTTMIGPNSASTPAVTGTPNNTTTNPNAAAAAQNAAAMQLAAAALAASAASGNTGPVTPGLLNPTGTQTSVATGNGVTGTNGPGGATSQSSYYSFNRQAGLINVFATQKQHKQINDYLIEMRQAINTQVLIEAKVLEVELNDENSLGIEWSVIGNHVTGGLFFPQENFTSENFDSSLTNGILSISSGDFNAVINAISRFGTVHSLSSPRLTVMNNQTAVLNVSESRVFFQLEINRTEGTANTNPRTDITSTVNNVPEGLILTVLPSIDPDTHEIMMNLRPSITRVVRSVSDPATRIAAQAAGLNLESFVPELSIREMDSMVKMQSGSVIVMGGLMQDRTDNRQVGVPVLSEIPVIGAAFRSQRDTVRKTELVVMLRAQVLDNATPDATDKDLYKTMGQDRHPFNP